MTTTQPAVPPLTPGSDLSDRLRRVRADLARAERLLRRTRRRDAAAIVVALAATSLTTMVAGSAAALNHAVWVSSWRVTCTLAAGLSAVGAVATGLRQQFSSGDRLSRAAACVARLRGLEFALSVGGVSPETADAQYRELIEQYAEYLAAE